MTDRQAQRGGGLIRRMAGKIIRAVTGDACCCAPLPQWITMRPCDIHVNGWWFCPASLPPAYWYACKWVRYDKYLELRAAAGCESAEFGVVVYESASDACYLLPGPEYLLHLGSAVAPGVDATDTITALGCNTCCDFCACDGAGNPDPPGDPPPPPPPAPCSTCGATGVCGNCTCTPNVSIRVNFTGWTACACVGPCGHGPSYEWARMADGVTLNGTYDMSKLDACTWRLDVAKELTIGPPGSPTQCDTDSATGFTILLTKLSSILWVLVVYSVDPDPLDPRLDDNTHDFQQWRLFKGVSGTTSGECMSIGAMGNDMTCGCRDTATSDGRFDLGHGGVATFTILCP